MSNFTNREALYSAFVDTPEMEWASFCGQFATEGTTTTTPLYYLSLDPNLGGDYIIGECFEDKLTAMGDHYHQELFTVALPPRLLTSPDIQGCWNQVFNKVKHCFAYESDFTKPIDVYLYEVDVTNCVVIGNHELTTNWLVHDAYMNQTHAVFGHPTLKPVQKFSVTNTLGYPDEYCTYYYPFNDGRYLQALLSTPLEVIETTLISTDN